MPVSEAAPLIVLPAFLSARACGETIAICQTIQDAEGDVSIDAAALRFADPFGLALLGATFQQLSAWGQKVIVSHLRADVGAYLQRMDVFPGVELRDCAPVGRRRHDRRDALVELTCITDRGAVGDAAQRLTSALIGAIPDLCLADAADEMSGLTRADRVGIPIGYVLSELLENSLTHARRAGYGAAQVWVAGQYYPTKNLFRLAVADNGCGFLATLREHPELRHQTHRDAILTAMKPRVSCNRDLGVREDTENQGVGLTMVVRIAQASGGKSLIVSGNGCHDPARSVAGLPEGVSWQGVAIQCR